MNLSAKLIALRQMPLLKDLTEEQLNLFAEHALFQKYTKNALVYDLGSHPDFVYFIEKGSVKLGILASCGKTLTKDIAYDYEIFGENIFTPNPINKEYAETMLDTKLYKIPVSVFKTVIVQNSKFAHLIMNVIVTKLQNIEERLQNFVFRKAKERIVDFIYRTGLRKGIKIGINECLIDHGMSHKEIAFLTDTSRQTVARIMNELKRENYIHYGTGKSCKILIRDMNAMHEYRWVG
jgi:CRP-like cAMP-binding protein